MPYVTLAAVEDAIRQSWSVDTCDPIDQPNWTADDPTRGQCAATALVMRDLFGGQLLEAEVHFANGDRQGFHYWNRLQGVEIDLTHAQFKPEELVQPPVVVDGPPEFPWIVGPQYEILRQRVFALVGLDATTV